MYNKLKCWTNKNHKQFGPHISLTFKLFTSIHSVSNLNVWDSSHSKIMLRKMWGRVKSVSVTYDLWWITPQGLNSRSKNSNKEHRKGSKEDPSQNTKDEQTQKLIEVWPFLMSITVFCQWEIFLIFGISLLILIDPSSCSYVYVF